MNVCVVGLGKLGCPMAAFFQSRGHAVSGLDTNWDVVSAVRNGQAPVEETGLQELMTRHLFPATMDRDLAVFGARIVFVILPTPSQNDGRFSTRIVGRELRQIAISIRRQIDADDINGSGKLIVLCSTVMPGDCETLMAEMELAGDLKCGEDFLFCYNPEFVALGDVLRNMAEPDFILIGASDSEASNKLVKFWQQTVPYPGHWLNGRSMPDGDQYRVMNLVNAEIAKLALNTFVTLKISYANMLGALCELTPGADAHVVTQAIGHDLRIGHKALRPGLGFGGPCFPRDTKAFAALLGYDEGPYHQDTLPEAARAINDRQTDRVSRLVKKYLPIPNGVVAILGRGYKVGTAVTEQSQSLQLERELRQTGITSIAMDECSGAEVIVVALPDPRYAVIDCRKETVVIDCWGIVESTPGKLIKMGKWYCDT